MERGSVQTWLERSCVACVYRLKMGRPSKSFITVCLVTNLSSYEIERLHVYFTQVPGFLQNWLGIYSSSAKGIPVRLLNHIDILICV